MEPIPTAHQEVTERLHRPGVHEAVLAALLGTGTWTEALARARAVVPVLGYPEHTTSKYAALASEYAARAHTYAAQASEANPTTARTANVAARAVVASVLAGLAAEEAISSADWAHTPSHGRHVNAAANALGAAGGAVQQARELHQRRYQAQG